MQSIIKESIIVAALLFGAVSVSNAQVKVGANSTIIGTNSNLEVEAANGNKTIVDKATGKVTIQDGTQGVDKVLTSDATGVTSWKSFGEAKVPMTTFIGSTDTQVTLVNSATGAVTSRVPLIPGTGYNNGWDAAQRAYVVPVSGYYRAEFVAMFSSTVPTNPTSVVIVLRGKIMPSANENFHSNNYGVRSLVETAYYNAGDLIYAHAYGGTTSANTYIYKSSMNITYVP